MEAKVLCSSSRQSNKQTNKTHTCTFLVASCLTTSVGVDCPGNFKPCGVGFVSGRLEPSSLYRSCLVAAALVTTALAGVGFGCANNPCSVT